MKKLTAFGILLLTITFADHLFAQPTDSSYALPYLFIDINGDGINDNYIAGNAAVQYKYEFGVGYGYGFADNDSNGLNDVLKLYPNAGTLNPLIDSTRLQGLERIKRAEFRHGKITDRAALINPVREHAIHDGHCKSDSLFNAYRKRIQ